MSGIQMRLSPFHRKAWWFCLTLLLTSAVSLPVLAQSALSDEAEEDESEDAGYRILLRDVSTSVSSKGLKTTRIHNRMGIQKQHAVDLVGDVSIPYNAFRGEARLIKAFTETANGDRG